MSTLESWFFLISFVTAFIGMLIAGVVVHDFIDRNRRRIDKMLKR